MSTTRNLRLNKPNFNLPLWHDEVNDNWEIIDAAITTYLTITNVVGAWENGTAYAVGEKVIDTDTSTLFECAVGHTSSASPATFAEDRAEFPSYWTAPSIVARGLGNWAPATSYEPNDFVIGTGNIFSVCISPHISSASFSADAAYWDYLLDLSTLGAMPAFFPADAGKFLRVNLAGTTAEWADAAAMKVALGLQSMAYQSASLVNITGGNLDAVTVSNSTITTPTVAGGTFASPTITTPTITVGSNNNGMYQVMQVFNSSGTWTKPANIRRVKVTVVGGGGAGGGANATAAGQASMGAGGGGGGTAVKTVEAAALAATVTVTVGAGGTGVSGGTGNTGGTSSFGTHAVATGGTGGSVGAANASASPSGSGGGGGNGTTGDLTILGMPGIPGFKNALGVGGLGGGGSSTVGGGVPGAAIGSSTAGAAAGANTGGGGRGAANIDTDTAKSGGAGGSGIVYVEEFY